MRFNSYSVLVTENCNLACTYCYEVNSSGHKNRVMSVETAEAVVAFAVSEWAVDKKGDVVFSVFGGEPTLNVAAIEALLSASRRAMEVNSGLHITFGMITNSTVMNERLYDVFRYYNGMFNSVQLSIDGPARVQDACRVQKDGSGSFALVEKNIPFWKALFGERLNIHGVLNSQTMGSLFESFLFFREGWAVPKLWFLPAKDASFSPEDVAVYDRELGKIYDWVMSRVRATKRLDEVNNYAPLDRSLRPVNARPGKPCGAGASYCSITSSGEIFPCHHFYFVDGKKETRLGDIFSGYNPGKKLIWDSYDALDMRGCEGCDHAHCYRCVAENYEHFGTPFSQLKGLHCEFMRVDKKYQDMIRKEVQGMGLLKENCGGDNGACEGYVRDCVGKVGDCPVVVSVADCKFDRKESAGHGDQAPPPFSAVSSPPAADGVVITKDDVAAIDEAIGLLTKIYNRIASK